MHQRLRIFQPKKPGLRSRRPAQVGCAQITANRKLFRAAWRKRRGRYTHRVAISNHRLVSLTDGQVIFRWRDSAHNNEQKLMTLSRDEFLRRFLLHLLPKGFVRIRNFGFLANRRRATLLPLCFHLLGSAPRAEQDIADSKDSSDLWLCPKCGGPMRVIERFTAAEMQLRSPPAMVSAAA